MWSDYDNELMITFIYYFVYYLTHYLAFIYLAVLRFIPTTELQSKSNNLLLPENE